MATPGAANMPRWRACAITAGLQFGETIMRPPAACTASTSAGVSMVPPPTSASAGAARTMAAMPSIAPGRFSGTSTMRKPASNSTRATSTARSASRPRRMATRGGRGQVGSLMSGDSARRPMRPAAPLSGDTPWPPFPTSNTPACASTAWLGRVIVTGGASGIGADIVRAFAQQGCPGRLRRPRRIGRTRARSKPAATLLFESVRRDRRGRR